MNWLKQSPVTARVAPFAIFLGLTFFQDVFGGASRYWLYLLKTLAGAGMIWVVRPVLPEMRWRFSWEAVLTGAAVFVMWIKLGDLLRLLGINSGFAELKLSSGAWNPNAQFGESSALACFFIGVRFAGPSLVVPCLEEVFYRSFVYRYLARADFQSVPLGQFFLVPFLVTSAAFGLEHRYWLAGLLCGFAYQGLVCWKKRLGDAITAHAITNFLLGLWVVWRGAWHFW